MRFQSIRNSILYGSAVNYPNPLCRMLNFIRLEKSEKTAVIVLGMHRSGTSLLTNLIGNSDVDIGNNFIEEAPDNPKGFFEDEVMVNLNRQVLTALQLNKDGFSAYDNILAASEKSARLVNRWNKGHILFYIRKNYVGNFWAFKDPRTCITLPFWMQIFDSSFIQNVKIVLVYRDPKSVAKSLLKRGSDDYFLEVPSEAWSRAYSTWHAYNTLCFSYLKNYQHHVISFDDLMDQQKIGSVLNSCLNFIGCEPRQLRKQVLDQSLVHHRVDLQHVPKDCIDLYKKLEEVKSEY